MHNLAPGFDKFAPKATKCVFAGYSRTQKGYKCWNPQSRSYVVCADVTFFEGTSFFEASGLSLDGDLLVPSLPLPLPIPPSDTAPLQVYHRRSKPSTATDQPAPPPPPPPQSSTSTEVPS